jgi:hypothetical protein
MTAIINPYAYGGALIPNVDYISSENIAGGSFTSANVDAITIGGSTLLPNTDYFLFASVDVVTAATTFNPGIQILNVASALYNQAPQYRWVGATDAPRSLFFMRKVTTNGNPGSDSWILRIVGDGTNSVTYSNARLVLIRVGPQAQYAESRTRSTTTSSTYTTVCSLTFTPATTGRYLILGYLIGDKSGGNFDVQVTDGTLSSASWLHMPNTSERIPAVFPLELTLTGGVSKTINLQVRDQSAGGNTMGFADCCIIAIRLDRYANAYGAMSASGPQNFLTSYNGVVPIITFTPNAADHLTMAFGTFRNNTAGDAAIVEYDDGGTILTNPSFRANTASGFDSSFFSARIASYSAARRVQKIDHKCNAGSSTTRYPTVFTFDLGGGAAVTGSIAVRGSAIASSSGSSLSLTFPAGSAAGDRMVLFTGHGFTPNTVSGWTMLDQLGGSNWQGAVYTKILDSTDISTGSVTIGYSGSFNGVRAGIVFQGSPSIMRCISTSRNSSGSTSRSLTTDGMPRSGDYIISFESGRIAGNCTCDTGSQLQTVNAANASGALYGGTLGADGAKTVNFTYPATPTGDFQAIVVVRA